MFLIIFYFQFFPSSPEESVLDFGTVGMNEKRDLYFALINKGPVKVVLRGWGGNITGEATALNLMKVYHFCNKTSLKLLMRRQLKLKELPES